MTDRQELLGGTAEGALRGEVSPRQDVRQLAMQAVAVRGKEGVFHSYQKEAVRQSHLNDLVLIEKSRRIGITWGFAGDDVITAATARGEGGDDVFYMGTSYTMAREYIDACAGFARAFMGIDATVGEFMFNDEDPEHPGESRDIKAFRIDFASGYSIEALTSAARSFRGRQGKVRIDEGAFVDNLKELVKAALALILLGSSVVVMSTHNGVDNYFNKLIQEVRSGERAGKVVRITFQDALDDGFYERIATIRGWPTDDAAKAAWVAKIRKTFGDAAEEELDAIPSKSSGSWLAYDLVERAERPGVPIVRLECENAFAFKADYIRLAFIEQWCETNLLPLLKGLDRSTHGVGGDFARSSDLSVIWVLKELQTRAWETPFVVEMRNVPFTEQEFVWTFILRRIRVWRCKLDANGNGAHLAERMAQIFGRARVEGVKAQADWWRDEGTPLKSRFTDDRIGIPRDASIASDLRLVQVVNGAPAIPKLRTTTDSEGGGEKVKRHGDAAVALFHASAALRQGAAIEVGGEFSGPTGAPSAFLSSGLDPEAVYEPLDFGGY